jgi:hypothetical protein
MPSSSHRSPSGWTGDEEATGGREPAWQALYAYGGGYIPEALHHDNNIAYIYAKVIRGLR